MKNIYKKNIFKIFFISSVCCFTISLSFSQTDSSKIITPKTFKNHTPKDKNIISIYSSQKDIGDILRRIFKNLPKSTGDSAFKKIPGKIYYSVLPAAGYTLETGFAVALSGNAAFYKSADKNANISSISTSVAYTQYHQIIVPIHSNIWSKGNKYNYVGDWRFMKYPQNTYGLGNYTSLKDADLIDYSYIRIYQVVMKHIIKDFYAGVGYNLDVHWKIREKGPDTVSADFNRYKNNSNAVSSGLSLNFLYDNRRNSINPPGGWYGNVIYRPNFKFLGSDQNWQLLILDFRKYIKIPNNSKNILAFWTYNWFTLSGNPPYLDLPSTGWDSHANTGRGYIQGRFRGRNMLYLETEYRYNLTRNGLLGGVVFTNVESFTEEKSGKFEKLLPAAGAGLRIKLNKYSNTNISIDYAFGIGGSQGVFFNLGEVF